ncbi:MAG: hypothetical protein WC728_13980 [Elusimicrobiota bacterium]
MSDDQKTQDKERKGVGLPAWMTGGAAKVGAGSGGGAGLGGASGGLAKLAAFLTSKAGIAVTVAGGLALGGAVSFNEMHKTALKRSDQAGQSINIRTASDSMRSGFVGGEGRSASSLSLAQQANRGVWGAEGEAPKQDAAASEENKDAASPGTPDEKAGAAGAVGQGDPTAQAQAMAAALAEEQKSGANAALGRKFGQMTSGLGSKGMDLAGGAGLSGGIGQGFAKPKLDVARATQGMSQGRAARVVRATTPANSKGSKLSGATARRLDGMNKAMGTARKSGAESQSSVHSQQWDGAQPGGQSILGAGSSGVGEGGFSEDEGGGGGPVNASSDGGTATGETPQPPSTGGGENVTPYQGQLNMAVMMLALASAIITVIGILSYINKTPLVGQAVSAIQTALLAVATLMALAATMVGISIMSNYGQPAQGTILTVAGAITTATGIAAMVWQTMPAWLCALGGVVGFIGACWGALAK